MRFGGEPVAAMRGDDAQTRVRTRMVGVECQRLAGRRFGERQRLRARIANVQEHEIRAGEHRVCVRELRITRNRDLPSGG